MEGIWGRPVILKGEVVQLEPLLQEHTPALALAGRDEQIWRYMLYGNVNETGRMQAWVEEMLARQSAGTDLPFVVIHRKSCRLVGATRYLDMRPAHRSLEIGGTWYAPEYQRTAVNTECKYLLMSYAFETLGCIRVQFKADARNARSMRAIERLGAVREGILRNHMILPDGKVRDSVFYSVLDREWPAVKTRLRRYLER